MMNSNTIDAYLDGKIYEAIEKYFNNNKKNGNTTKTSGKKPIFRSKIKKRPILVILKNKYDKKI